MRLSMEEKIEKAYKEGRVSKEYLEYFKRCKAESVKRKRNRTPEEKARLIRIEKEANAARLAEHQKNWDSFVKEFHEMNGHVEVTEKGFALTSGKK